MIVYSVMTVISLFFSIYAQNTKPYPALRNTYRLLAVCSAIPFIAVSVFRYEVGIDWNYVYSPYYYYINHGIDQYKEIGFNFLNRFFYLFTENSWILFAFVGFVTNLLFFLAFYEQSDSIPFSILLYLLMSVYFASLNQIRQMLAMAIFVYALKHVYSRKWKSYFLLILLASTIHISSLMYIPVFFLYGKKLTVKQAITILTACVLGLPVLKIAIIGIVSLTSYGWYLSSAFSQNNFYLLGFLVNFVFLLFHILFLYIDETTQSENPHLPFMTCMMLISTIILLLSAVIPQISRVADGFSVIQLFSLPQLIKNEKNGKMRLLCILLVLSVYGVKFLYDTYVNQWHGVLPYLTIFSR